MTFDKWASRTFLTIGEAVVYLSEKSGESQDFGNRNRRVRAADVLRSALDGSLPLAVDVPTLTQDLEGLIIEAGIWTLVMEGERATPARRQIEYDYHVADHLSRINIDGIEGAWIARDGVQRQLEPIANQPSAIGAGCVLGARREALDALLAEKMPSADALDKPFGARERTTLLSIIAGLVKIAKIDLSRPSKAAAEIEAKTGTLGVKVAARTAEDHLKKVRKLLDERGNPPD